MTISSPPTLTDLPATPNKQDQGTFNARVVAMFDMLKGIGIPEWRTMMDWIRGAASDAATSASTAATQANNAAGSAVAAQTAAGVAVGASNFKGNWSSLAGALNTPACVKHNGRFWLLLNSLADVTAATPGVSASWTSLDTGTAPSAVITTDTVGVVGVRYRIAAACKLTLPTSYVQGDFIGFALQAGVTSAYVDFGATKFQGLDVGLMRLDIPLLSRSMTYENATLGLSQ